MNLYRECEDCEGTGYALTSNCCDAPFDTDFMICSECKEHLGDNECRNCKGETKILNHLEHDEY